MVGYLNAPLFVYSSYPHVHMAESLPLDRSQFINGCSFPTPPIGGKN